MKKQETVTGLVQKMWPFLLPRIETVIRHVGGGNGGGGSSGSGTVGLHVLATNLGLGPDHTVSGLTPGQVLKATGATTAEFEQVQHSELGGLTTGDPHTQYVLRTESVLAGDGLTGGGTLSGSITLNIGGGDGMQINADNIAVDSTVVRTGRTLTAGSGLTGGGDLSQDRTFAIGAGDGITVNADDIAVNASALADGDNGIEVFSNDFRIKLAPNGGLTLAGGVSISLASPGGLQMVSNELAIADSIAGNGLAISGKVLAVGVSGVGLSTDASSVILTSSSNPGATESILKSTGAGGLTLESMLINGALVVGQSITAAASAFRVIHHTHDYPHAHVVVNPGGFWNLDEQFGVDIDDNLLVRGWIVGKHAIQLPGATMILHFDGQEPYETNFKGNVTGHMGQVGTITGGVIFRPGKFGKAVQIAHGGTNLIPNPSFETTYSTGYDVQGGATLGYSNAAVYGTQSRTVTTSAANAGYGWAAAGVTTAGSRYRFSAYVRGTGTVKLALRDNVTGYQETGSFVLTNDWQRISLDAVYHVSSTTREVWLRQSGAGTMTLYTDGWMLMAGDALIPYLDGSMGNGNVGFYGSGHSWSGTAHESSSTRVDGTLSYTAAGVVQNTAGTVMLWMERDAASAYLNQKYVFQVTTGGSERLEFYQESDDQWTCRALKSDASGFVYAIQNSVWALTPGAWHHITVTWDLDNLTIYRDGVLWGTVATIGGGGIPFALGSDQIWIGGQGNQWDGLFDDFVFADRAVTADEIRAIYESNAPVFAETSTWHFRSGRNRVLADSEGLWVYNLLGQAAFGVYSGAETDGAGAKSWGGISLDPSDILLGDSNRGGYVKWDDSAATLEVEGTIIITGGSGITSLTDAGALVTADDLDDVADGSTHKKTTANEKTGAGRAFTGLDSNNSLITKVLPGSNVGTPGGAGLFLGADKLGFYNGSAWKTYMDNSGNFFFAGTGGATIAWDGTDLYGTNGATVQWYARSTDGKLYAGAGDVIIDSSGVTIKPGASYSDQAAIKFKNGSTQSGAVYAVTTGSINQLNFNAQTIAGLDSFLGLSASADSSNDATLRLTASSAGGGDGVIDILDTPSGSTITTTSTALNINGITTIAGTVDVTGNTTIQAALRVGSAGAPSRKIHIQHSGSSGADDFMIESNAPDISFWESDGSTNNKLWDFLINGEQFAFRVVNDAADAASNIMTVDRTTTTVDVVAFPNGALHVGGTGGTAAKLTIDGAMRVRQSGSTRYRFDFNMSGGQLAANAYDDTGGVFIPAVFGASTITFGTGTAGSVNSTLDASGNLTLPGTIKTTAGNAWNLGAYNAGAPAATGYVSVVIGGVTYKLIAST